MKVLVVCSGNPPEEGIPLNFEVHKPFINEQINSLRRMGIEIDTFLIKGKGLLNYLKNLSPLRDKIKENNYNLIHAHAGFAGLLSNLQRNVPVITTFHGCDLQRKKYRWLSYTAIFLSKYVLYVSKRMMKIGTKIRKSQYAVVPCGVDLNLFKIIDKKKAREILGFDQKKKYLLFSSFFRNSVKNYPLAKEALIGKSHIELIELKGYTRKRVNLLINACDLLLMTSFREGSPQVIKEAMACGCPIVSTDVGDVKEIIGDTEGCYITSFDPYDVSEKIQLALDFNKRTRGREKIADLRVEIIASKLKRIYCQILSEKGEINGF